MNVPAFPRPRVGAATDWVALLFVSATLGVIVLYRHWPASPFWLPAALAGIALAVWHGAYDTVLATNLWQPRYVGRWLLPFVASYVGLAAVVVLVWTLFPVVALVAFLLYSGLHFGTETESGRSPLRLAGALASGCLPIAAACHWQASTVASIFVTMLRGRADAAESITAAAGALLAPLIFFSLASVVGKERRAGARRAVLVMSQLLLFRFCPPVLAFAVFFCVLHTPEHLIETSRTATNVFSAAHMWHNLRAGVGPWLLSLAAIAVAAWMGRQTVQAYTGSLFIALSALTIPHMALAMLVSAERHRNEQSPSRSLRRTAHL